MVSLPFSFIFHRIAPFGCVRMYNLQTNKKTFYIFWKSSWAVEMEYKQFVSFRVAPAQPAEIEQRAKKRRNWSSSSRSLTNSSTLTQPAGSRRHLAIHQLSPLSWSMKRRTKRMTTNKLQMMMMTIEHISWIENETFTQFFELFLLSSSYIATTQHWTWHLLIRSIIHSPSWPGAARWGKKCVCVWWIFDWLRGTITGKVRELHIKKKIGRKLSRNFLSFSNCAVYRYSELKTSNKQRARTSTHKKVKQCRIAFICLKRKSAHIAPLLHESKSERTQNKNASSPDGKLG